MVANTDSPVQFYFLGLIGMHVVWYYYFVKFGNKKWKYQVTL